MKYKLLTIAIIVASFDQGNAQSCTATNGKKCIFPFFHKGKRFTGCTTFTAPRGDPAWCSTKVTEAGVHISGNYGDCPRSCPNDKPDAQEEVRRLFVKENCKVKGGTSGVCVPSGKCKSVSSPKKGTCSERSHVCCYFEKPSGASDRMVKSALSKQSRLRADRFSERYNSPLQAVNLPQPGANEIDLDARKIRYAAKEINDDLGFSSRSSSLGFQPMKHFNAENNKEIKEQCSWFKDAITGRPRSYDCNENNRPLYRSIDGSCNSLVTPQLGQANTPFQRIVAAEYGDDGEGLRLSKFGQELPNARKLSVDLAKSTDQADGSSAFMTVFVMEMGQFIDHDVASTPNHRDVMCCDGNVPGKDINDPKCAPIIISPDDPYYSRHGRTCMAMTRSKIAPDINCAMDSNGQQQNGLTDWLDNGNIYGNSDDVSKGLREFKDGLLKTSKDHNMLPKCSETQQVFDIKGHCIAICPSKDDGKEKSPCFAAGDHRVNEHHGLVSIHTLWMREHNRVAKELKKSHSRWNDEKLFQEARRIVIAEYQHIIYNEWLPVILGKDYMNRFGISTLSSGYSNAYFGEGAKTEQFDPRVSNEFATAAFRFGHSLIPPNYKRFSQSSRQSNSRESGEFSQRKAFFTPADFRTDNNHKGDKDMLNELLLGLSKQKGENSDNIFAEDIQNHLFERNTDPNPGKISERKKEEGTGTDLVAINIQRGRDHGIPGYNRYREECGLGRAEKFSDFGKEMTPENWKKLEKAYKHVDDVDLFAGGFMEQAGAGCSGRSCGILGPVFKCIVGDTFMRLRYGDRYFYDLDQDKHKFALPELNEIRKTSLARILCDNAGLFKMQPRAFILPGSSNKEVSCDNLPKVNLSKFNGL